MRIQGGSHDPSLSAMHRGVMTKPASQPEWIVCRKLSQFPISDDTTLCYLAERGRVEPDDYLFNVPLDTCLQAKDIAELAAIFHAATVRRLGKLSWLLAKAFEVAHSLRGKRCVQ